MIYFPLDFGTKSYYNLYCTISYHFYMTEKTNRKEPTWIYILPKN